MSCESKIWWGGRGGIWRKKTILFLSGTWWKLDPPHRLSQDWSKSKGFKRENNSGWRWKMQAHPALLASVTQNRWCFTYFRCFFQSTRTIGTPSSVRPFIGFPLEPFWSILLWLIILHWYWHFSHNIRHLSSCLQYKLSSFYSTLLSSFLDWQVYSFLWFYMAKHWAN